MVKYLILNLNTKPSHKIAHSSSSSFSVYLNTLPISFSIKAIHLFFAKDTHRDLFALLVNPDSMRLS